MQRWLNSMQPWGAVLLRLVLGTAMVYSGWSKVIPPTLHGNILAPLDHYSHYIVSLGIPAWLGYVSALAELVGGFFLVLGLLTRISALFITIDLLVALFKVNLHHGYNGSQYLLALIVIAMMLLFYGPGTASLDNRFGAE